MGRWDGEIASCLLKTKDFFLVLVSVTAQLHQCN